MIRPSLEEARSLAAQGSYRCLPLARELFADIRTPIEVMRILKAASDHCYLLESVESSGQWGRFTFLGYDPSLEITCLDGVTFLDGEPLSHADPAEEIRAVLQQHRAPRLEGMPPFCGGLVGYFSYEYLKYAEPTLVFDTVDEEGFKDVDLMMFDKVIAFDHQRQKIVCIANIPLDGQSIDDAYRLGCDDLQAMVDLIEQGEPVAQTAGRITSPVRRLFDEREYCHMVERAQEHIKEGDIFQVVLSNRLDADFEGSLLDTYRVLRTSNPSPYMFYFSSDDIEMAGASPETLVKLENGELHTFPLAGTCRRGLTPEEDEDLARALLEDEKELAEHNMLVDLGRNDIGKISEFGTVEVENYHRILRYSHVMHIGSTVRGQIDASHDAVDAIRAVLPAGTLSGAPKIRACQIINDLEGGRRGIYGGAVGYLDLTGNLDTCIAIRLAFKKNGRVFVRSGAGIVADSHPASENQECINKAAAVVDALRTASALQEEPAAPCVSRDPRSKGDAQPASAAPVRKGGQR